MKIEFDDEAVGNTIRAKKPLEADTIARLRYVKDNLHYAQVFERYRIRWVSMDTHQLSCPFHGKFRDAYGIPYEGNPSARYYADSQRFWCHACGMGGDVVWFVQQWEKLSNTKEALEFIEREFGVGLNLQNLPQRIKALSEVVDDGAEKRKILLNLYQDKVNDMIHQVRKVAPMAGPLLDKVQPEIVRKRVTIERSNPPYPELAKQLRDWRDWAVGVLKRTVEKVQRGEGS